MANRERKLVFHCLSLCFLVLLILCYHSCFAKNTIFQGEQLKPGEDLISSSGMLQLGMFYRFGYENMSYLGIWYTGGNWDDYGEVQLLTNLSNIMDQPVWVANRDNPVMVDSVLAIDGNGSLKILSDKGKHLITLYDSSTAPLINASATLQDNGNFVLNETSSDGFKRTVWQSFNYPTNTLLPGMKLGINLKTGFNWSLTSWRSYGSPASGSFTLGIDPNTTNQLMMWWRGQFHWTSGPDWRGNKVDFSSYDTGYNFHYTIDENETYMTYDTNKEKIIFPKIRLDEWGRILIYSRDNAFFIFTCSPFSVIGGSDLDGCVNPMKYPECRTSGPEFYLQNGFMSRKGFKISESENLTHLDCEIKCWNNCSCIAYALVNDDKTGCEIWTSEATFTRSATGYDGRDIYLAKATVKNWWLWITILVGAIMVIPPLGSICYVIWEKCIAKGHGEVKQRILLRELGGREMPSLSFGKVETQKKDGNELCIFSFESIAVATNYFSMANQLGKGGFGPVYKGNLSDGREVAIKRLSRSSGQGVVEFKNEAVLIAKLQHTNLVKLLGFCIEGDEKILVYEYMPNKSLDSILFDNNKKKILNWKRRFIIIEGIAQGLLYLHKYSRLRVIHRDLKVSNILLDDEMNPKISDFGMARIFGLNELEANTNRVVGTHGYMSPEYAFHGVVSIKTDVFSFGVLLLEVVSGKKNSSLYHSEHLLNLSGYAWQLWTEGRGLELVDSTLDELRPQDEILRCIHIGLLCVQDNAKDRPTMSDVVSMLSNEYMSLPEPKQPAFFINTATPEEHGISETKSEKCSINEVSISVMEAR